MSELFDLIDDLRNRKDEEEWFEFKENWFEPRQIGEYISALSNAAAVCGKEYGYLIWGVNDKTHNIVGTDLNYKANYKDSPFENYLAINLKPSIHFKFEEIFIDDKRLVILFVPKAVRVPTSFMKTRFTRIGSSKVSLENYPEREALIWQTLTKGYPTMVNTESPIQNLTFIQLKNYYLARNLEFNDNFKENMKLYTSDGKYNMLACFLADNGNIPVRVAIFSGFSKSDPLFSVREFGSQSLIGAIDKIIDYSNSINMTKSIEHLDTGYREDIPLFDQQSFNEAVKNAFIHNCWLYRAAPMITFYEDRVEIISFSSLAPNQTLKGFFTGKSKPVNEDLSIIYLNTHLSERTGKGVPLIVSRYGKEVFDISDSSIKVTLPYNWRQKFEATIESNQLLNQKLNNKKINNVNKVIKCISNNPNITEPELAVKLNVGKTTIHNIITKLKESNIVKRVGSNKSGYWQLLD